MKRKITTLMMISCMLFMFAGCGSKTDTDLNVATPDTSAVESEETSDTLKSDVIDAMEQSETAESENSKSADFSEAYAKMAYLGAVESKDGRFVKYFVTEMEDGLDFDFESLMIGDLIYNSGLDGRIGAMGYDVTPYIPHKDETIPHRYVLEISDTEDFSPEDMTINVRNSYSQKYEKDAVKEFDYVQVSDFSYDAASLGYYHLFEIENNLYFLDTSSMNYQGDRVFIEPENVKWASEGASAETLFTTLADNAVFAERVQEDPLNSTTASLAVETNDDGEPVLAKHKATGADQTPGFIAYVKENKRIYIMMN